KLGNGLKKSFAMMLAPAKRGGRKVFENDAYRAAENKKSGVAVIAFAHDDVAVGIADDAGVIQEDTAQRGGGGEAAGVDAFEGLDRQQFIHILLGHLRAKRRIPALRPVDNDRCLSHVPIP